jgi:hypothetical protein
MGSGSTEKFKKRFRTQFYRAFAIFVVLATTLCSSGRPQKEPFDITFQKYESCQVSAPQQTSSTTETKPLWLTAHPSTIREPVHKGLINGITGLSAGGKSFYSSNKGLRHCNGETVTATCTNIHPIVEMNGGPDKKKDNFYSLYIMALRNPMTALPAFIDEKGILYHGRSGQTPIESWRQTRDDWLQSLFDGWISVLRDWKKSSYDVGAYLVYEDFMDSKKGPNSLKSTRHLLEKAGFDVVLEDSLGCIWFQAIGKDALEQHHGVGYEYNDYTPGFTVEQKEYMVTGLNDAIEEFKDDKMLTEILTVYRNEIAQHCLLDVKWTNSSATTSIS